MTDEKILTHIDLFSGIGGFTLAAEWAGFETIIFCEKEKFCQKILKKHWPGIPIIEEIRNFNGKKWRGATLLTGGFPCQPFSVAGQRRGKEDDRYLWPEMLKVIDEAKPRWILAENVPGIFRMALDTVLSDLESKGYATGTFIIPACGLNAPHRRNRIWILANSSSREVGGQSRGTLIRIKDKGWRDATNRMPPICSREKIPFSAEPGQADSDAADNVGNSGSLRLERKSRRRTRKELEDRLMGGIQNAPDSLNNGYSERHQKARRKVEEGKQGRMCKSSRESWDIPWLEVATKFCRVDDGISDRIHRLKALGNAIVPQIAYEILKNIAWIEKRLAQGVL